MAVEDLQSILVLGEEREFLGFLTVMEIFQHIHTLEASEYDEFMTNSLGDYFGML